MSGNPANKERYNGAGAEFKAYRKHYYDEIEAMKAVNPDVDLSQIDVKNMDVSAVKNMLAQGHSPQMVETIVKQFSPQYAKQHLENAITASTNPNAVPANTSNTDLAKITVEVAKAEAQDDSEKAAAVAVAVKSANPEAAPTGVDFSHE